jgi:hypothetical protein
MVGRVLKVSEFFCDERDSLEGRKKKKKKKTLEGTLN